MHRRIGNFSFCLLSLIVSLWRFFFFFKNIFVRSLIKPVKCIFNTFETSLKWINSYIIAKNINVCHVSFFLMLDKCCLHSYLFGGFMEPKDSACAGVGGAEVLALVASKTSALPKLWRIVDHTHGLFHYNSVVAVAPSFRCVWHTPLSLRTHLHIKVPK